MKETHLPNISDVPASRVEEEYRNRLFYYEEFHPPEPVTGQEVRRSLSSHARHTTHSYPGSRRINFDRPLSGGTGRSLGSCAICAMNHWQEDLVQMDIFVKPESGSHDSDPEDDDEIMPPREPPPREHQSTRGFFTGCICRPGE